MSKPTPAADSPESAISAPLRLLLIDDEPAILASFALAFGDQGWDVDTAPTGEEALSGFAAGSYDLVITDKNLPGIGGVEIVETIRGLDEDVTLMMLTGFGSAESALETLNAGVDAYVEKPVRDVIRLTARAESIIRRRAKKRQLTPPPLPPATRLHILILSGQRSRATSIEEHCQDLPCDVEVALSMAEAQPHLTDADLVLVEESIPDLIGAIEALADVCEDLPVAVLGQQLGLEMLMKLVDFGVVPCIVLPIGGDACGAKLNDLVVDLRREKSAAGADAASLRPVNLG